MKKRFVFIACLFLMSLIGLFAAENQTTPVQYKPDSGETPEQFFEREYKVLWKMIPEYQQFAIACTSNLCERRNQFHLDFGTRINFEDTTTGKSVLNDGWEIFNYDQLMEHWNELSAGEQNNKYIKLKELLEKYPKLSVLEIGKKEQLTVTEVSRMYFVKDKKDLLGIHNLEAWIDGRRISIMRWGIGAGYISEEEATALIKPVVAKIKDDYVSYEEFISHWIAGFCFNAVFDSTVPECTDNLLAAHKTARAYVPYELLAFTGKNADKNHTMTLEESIYTPSELAAKMIPAQKAFKRYWNDEPDISILNELIAAEKDYPEICDITFESHFILMCKFCSAQERADFVDANRKYVFSLDEKSELVNYVTGVYFNDLIRTYQPEKLISVYKALPNSLQTNEDNYFNYGYANYLMSNICSTVLERDIYISRAVNVFNQLKKRGYDNGNFINCWLNVVESL